MAILKRKKRFYFHKGARISLLIFSTFIPLFFLFFSKDQALIIFAHKLIAFGPLFFLGLFFSFFPLYILYDNKIYFFSTRPFFNKYHLGGISYEKITRIVSLKHILFLSLHPKGAIPILFLSSTDRHELVVSLIKKNQDIKEQNFH